MTITSKEVEQKLKVLPTTQEKIEYLTEVSTTLMRNHARTALKYALLAKAIARKSKVKAHLMQAEKLIGKIYTASGNFEKSLQHCLNALELSRTIKDEKSEGILLCYVGVNYMQMKIYDVAMDYYLQSLKIAERLRYNALIVLVRSNLGGLNAQLKNYSKALKEYKILAKLSKEDDSYSQATTALNIATLYQETKQYAKAEKILLPLFNNLTFQQLKASVALNLASLYLKLNQPKTAIYYALIGKDSAIESGHQQYLPELFSFLAIGYWKTKQPVLAEKNFKQALKIALQTGEKENILDVQLRTEEFYEATGNLKQALRFYKAAIETKELISEDQRQSLKRSLQIKLQMQNISREKEEVEKRNKLLGQKNSAIEKERKKADALLLNILPPEVAEELKEKGAAAAKHFDDVTVLFTDFVGFTTVSETLSPQQLVDELHTCFSAFDEIIHKYNIEKIKTVGDAYLAVCGLPNANPNHAIDIVNAAAEIRDYMEKRKLQTRNSKLETFEVRIGIHSGSVVAGIVGVKKFAYDIWGDTVNTAARMEQNSEAGKINISETTYDLVKGKFTCEYRGEIEAKNKGKLKMYFVS